MYGLTEEEKLVATAMSLDGDTLSWYQWTNSREVFGSWENLKRRLLLRFRQTQEGSLCEQFLAVRQQGTMVAYRREFEILATPLKGILEKVMESTFMNGLLPEIRAELHLLQLYGLGHLMEMAQRVEDRNLAMRAAREPNGPKSTKMLSSTNQGDWKIGKKFQTRAVVVGEKTMSQRREIPIKRLTESELQACREKGLCFKCEEKFSPGHQCKKQLRVLLVHKDEDKDDNQFDGRATEEPALIELHSSS